MDNLNDGVSQQSSPQPTVEQAEQAPNKPPIKINWKYLAILVVLGLFVGVGTLWYGPSLRVQPQPSQTVTHRIIPSPTPIAIDASDWKLYRNDEVALSIELNDLTDEMNLEKRDFFRTFLSTFRVVE